MTHDPSFNPFPGLRPFRETEAHLFFGRSAHVNELLDELARSRFVAVMGASASGKSSLLHAGLLPALHGGFSPRAGSGWRIASLRPGANPIYHLARALAGPAVLGADDPDPLVAAAQVEARLRRSSLGLADAARQSQQLRDGRLLVVVDQFEELFRFHGSGEASGVSADAEPFVQLLIEVTRDHDAPVDVIITMRSDFLGDCSQFRDLPETINQGLYLVPRLTRLQLREAITAPAAVGGATLSPRLVQRLLNDAGADPDMLPVAQHAMMRTWDIWVQDGAVGPIDVEHYEACGGVTEALSRHADEAYFELEDGRRRAITEVMFRRITELGDDHREIRRPSPLAEIAAVANATPVEVEECISHFEEQRRSFVTVSPDGVVDISHESLIRQWPRLGAWVRDEAESREVYRRLANAAGRWERGEAALLRDPDLQIAAKWWTENEPNQAWAARYNPAFEPAARYLARSRSAARRRRAGAVAGVATVVILGLATALVVTWVHQQGAQAQRQQRTAISRQLAASSVGAGAASRSLSILAAVQAVRATEPDGLRLPVAEDALRQAMKDPAGVELASGSAGQDAPVMTAFSPDGSLVATGGGDGRVRVWTPTGASDAAPRPLSGDGAAITALAFSADGRWLVAGRADGTATLWDVVEPDPQPRLLADHASSITAVAFGGMDGGWLATAGRDGYVVLRRVDDLQRSTQRRRAHEGFVRSLAFSPDGTKLVTGGGDDVARVWTVDDLAGPFVTLEGRAGNVLAVAFSPDGRSVATGSADNTAQLWDLDRPGSPPVVLPHHDQVNSLAFSPDGAWLATGSDDHEARLWNLRDSSGPAANPVLLDHDDSVEVVAFSGARPLNGDSPRWLATGSHDSTARLFDMDHLLADPVVLGGHEGLIGTVAFGQGERWLVTGSGDGTARLWNLDHPSVQPAVLSHGMDPQGGTVAVATLAFSPDGRQLATGGSDKTVRLWQVDDLTATPRLLDHEVVDGFEQAGITALAFSPTKRWLATGSGDRRVRVWDLDDVAADPTVLPPYDAAVTALAYSPDGRWLATAVNGKVAFLSDANDLAAQPTPLGGHEDVVTSVAFSPDGRWLATGSRDGKVRLWTVADPSAEPQVLPGDDAITSLAFSPDGRQLAVGVSSLVGVGSSVRLWDPDSAGTSPVDELNASSTVTGVAYSPDGRTLVVAAGKTVQLWDLGVSDPATSVANPEVLRDSAGAVNAVAYSSDGIHFASASEDGNARVWLSLDALVDLGCRRVGRNLTHTEWQLLLPGERYHTTCDQ